MKHTWHQTRACSAFMTRLGVQQPIVLAPMAGVCTPPLTAAVSNEGGLGMFGAAATPLENLPGVLQDIKSLLKPGKLFGVNVFTPPRSVSALTPEQQQALEAVHTYYAGECSSTRFLRVSAAGPHVTGLQTCQSTHACLMSCLAGASHHGDQPRNCCRTHIVKQLIPSSSIAEIVTPAASTGGRVTSHSRRLPRHWMPPKLQNVNIQMLCERWPPHSR